MKPKLTQEEKRETFTSPDGREYFRHVPGDEMPCDWDKRVQILTRGGHREIFAANAFHWGWSAASNEIIGWRFVGKDEPNGSLPTPAPTPDPWKDEREKLQARVKEWQPIETAPKGETVIVFQPIGDQPKYLPNGRCLLAYQTDNEPPFINTWRYASTGPKGGEQFGWPTHWMPLPEPPTAHIPKVSPQ